MIAVPAFVVAFVAATGIARFGLDGKPKKP
jgi:hypothetical protein